MATSVIRSGDQAAYRHSAVLVGASGLLFAQDQVHFSQGHTGCALAQEFSSIDLSIGRVAVVTGDDSIYPETFRLLAMAGVEVALVPLSPQEDWELATGLLERSAENRINLLVAPATLDYGPGFITCLQTDFTVMTEWHERPFDGLLSQPEWYRCPLQAGISSAVIRPANAAHKVVSRNTDLLGNRPWQLAGAIAR